MRWRTSNVRLHWSHSYSYVGTELQDNTRKFRLSRRRAAGFALVVLLAGCSSAAERKAAEVQRLHARALYEQALVNLGDRRISLGMSALKQAIELDPDNALYRNALGVVLLDLEAPGRGPGPAGEGRAVRSPLREASTTSGSAMRSRGGQPTPSRRTAGRSPFPPTPLPRSRTTTWAMPISCSGGSRMRPRPTGPPSSSPEAGGVHLLSRGGAGTGRGAGRKPRPPSGAARDLELSAPSGRLPSKPRVSWRRGLRSRLGQSRTAREPRRGSFFLDPCGGLSGLRGGALEILSGERAPPAVVRRISTVSREVMSRGPGFGTRQSAMSRSTVVARSAVSRSEPGRTGLARL